MRRLRALYREESTLFPVWQLVFVGIIWTVVFVFAMLRGGGGAHSLVGSSCGSPLYWSLLFLNLAVLFCCTVFLREKILTR
jgi:hypothetical protein